MTKIKPRVKVPKNASFGEITELKALISHPMHTGRTKDKTGKKIPRNIINKMTVSFNGEEFFSANFEAAISANPFLTIPFKAVNSGEIKFAWYEDSGNEYTISKTMTVS